MSERLGVCVTVTNAENIASGHIYQYHSTTKHSLYLAIPYHTTKTASSMLRMRERFKKAWLYWLLPPTTAAPFLHSLTTTVHFPRCVRLENTVHSVAPLITGRFSDRLFGMCVSVRRNECWKSFRSSATVEAASTETLPQSASTDRRLPTQPLTWYPEEKWRTCAEQWVAQKLHNHISIAKAFVRQWFGWRIFAFLKC